MLSFREQLAEAERFVEDGQQDAALDRFTLILKDPRLKSDDFVSVSRQAGSFLTSSKRFDEAREIYMTAITRAKQHKKYEKAAELWHQSALNEISAGRADAAIQDLRNELDLMSSRYEGYFRKLSANYHRQGTLFLELGDLAESKLYFELALAFAETDGDVPAEANAQDGLARCYERKGELAQALLHFGLALEKYNETKDKTAAQRVRRQIKKLKEVIKG